MTPMKSGFGIFGGVALLAVLTAAPAAGSFRCLPTCDITDGRFLAIAGSGFDTLSPPELDLAILVPAGATSFDIGIFGATIAAADAWMASYPPGSGVKASSSAWIAGGPLHQTLDDYNNGRLCAPHRD